MNITKEGNTFIERIKQKAKIAGYCFAIAGVGTAVATPFIAGYQGIQYLRNRSAVVDILEKIADEDSKFKDTKNNGRADENEWKAVYEELGKSKDFTPYKNHAWGISVEDMKNYILKHSPDFLRPKEESIQINGKISV